MAKKPGPKNLPKKNNPFNYLIIVALAGAALALFFQGEEGIKAFITKPVEEITISEFIDKYEDEVFATVTIKDQKITAEAKDGTTFRTF